MTREAPLEPPRIAPCLMFEGDAEEAMRFYVESFPESSVDSVERWGKDEPSSVGKIKSAQFTLAGLAMRCFDSPVKHDFGFTPSVSLFVTSGTEAEVERLAARLSDDGAVLMPLDSYEFSRKYAWVQDRFGVSWQLFFQ